MSQILFQYYEIRPAVDFGTDVMSYVGDGTPAGAFEEAIKYAEGLKVFWTIYGRDQQGLAHAIGDFSTFEVALAVLQAILVPFRQAIDGCNPAADIEDILNQSSNEERL